VTNTPEPTSTPRPTSTPELERVIEIEASSYTINDDVPVFSTRFWLDEPPKTGSFLVLDVNDIHYANAVWMNDEFMGVVPGEYDNDNWQPGQKLFVPASALHSGENELRIESALASDNYDDIHIRNIKLELNSASVPPDDQFSETVIDADVHHIGDDSLSEWSAPEPENIFYTKFFELPKQPTVGAILTLKTYNVICAIPFRINDNLLGNLPGTGQDIETWTPDAHFYVPARYLQAGANSFRIDAMKCETTGQPIYDDFMVRDIRLLVEK
jgi:hypothetical protein